VQTWQDFPLRLVTAAWATTLTATVTLEKVKAVLEALPPTHDSRGQLVDVSSAEGLRSALKELDTLYKEAVEHGVHRPSSTRDRRSAFVEAFQQALVENAVGSGASGSSSSGGGHGGAPAPSPSAVVGSLRRLRRVEC